MRSAKVKSYKEQKWQAYILAAINSEEWQNRWEVEERLNALLPPEAMHRAHTRYWNKQRTVHSFKCTIIGATIRRIVRFGYIERSVPINPRGLNVGNYSLRLTKKGAVLRARVRHYFCTSCLNSDISMARVEANILCGHCHHRTLKITKI